MPRVTILDRYIIREIFAPTAAGLGLLTFALVTGRLLKLTDMVINRGVTLGEVLGLMAFVMPAFLELTLPMAVLLGVLLGFGRMSAERELTAARACGVSLYRMAVPVLLFAAVFYGLASWLAFSVRPWANNQLAQSLFRITRSRTIAGLKDEVFNHDLPGMAIYVEHVSPADSGLRGVLISDDRNPGERNTIIANRGMILSDERHPSVTIRLFDGSIFGVDTDSRASHVTSFKTYDLSVRPGEMLGMATREPEEMRYHELRRTIVRARATGKPDFEAESELASRYTVPLATILFALLGISLGMKPARGGQSERFGISVLLFFLYYSLMRVGETIAQRGAVRASLAMSIPDLLFTLLAVWLFYRSASDRAEQGRGPGDYLWQLVEGFSQRQEAS
jgi:lipopolysaccharide export system permease protein